MLLVPAIDLRGGACVRLHQGDFGAETRYALAPGELVARYGALGARWVHVVDLDGAREGSLAQRDIVLGLTGRGPALQVGGGVRSAAVIADLLDHGIERVVIGSAAVEQPSEVGAWLARFGAEHVCLAFDVRLDAAGTPGVRTRGWLRDGAVSLWEALAAYEDSPLRHVLCTDIARDGALSGPNLALYAEALRRYPQLAWQASGGVRDAADLAALARLGVSAVISGKALLEQRIGAEELRPYLPDASFPVSTSATDRS